MAIPHKTKQDAEDQERRAKLDASILKDITAMDARLFKDSMDRFDAISDAEWDAAVAADAEEERLNRFDVTEALSELEAWKADPSTGRPYSEIREELAEAQPWEPIVAAGSNVMKLAHGAAMQGPTAEMQRTAELTAQRARAYEQELRVQANRVGCPEYRGQIGVGEEWAAMTNASADDARSITNTYNKDLANQINKIRRDVPTANRNTYAKRIKTWNKGRSEWKDKQVQQVATNSARGKAQADFYQKNGMTQGTAVLRPRSAICPICLGWIARGEVPVSVALAEPGNWHPNCPHLWDITSDKLPPDGCANLWKPGGGPRVPVAPEPVAPEPISATPEWAPSMSKAEAELWAQDSTIKRDMWHVTTDASAEAIPREGFDLGRRQWGGMWGDGVYLAADKGTASYYNAMPRMKTLTLKTNVRKTFVYKQGKIEDFRPEDILRKALPKDPGRAVAQEMVRDKGLSATLQDLGYDLLHIKPKDIFGGQGGNQLIVFDPKNVVVIQ